MGGAASKYKIHPGRDDASGKRNKALLDANNASASVVSLIQKDAKFSRFYKDKVPHTRPPTTARFAGRF